MASHLILDTNVFYNLGAGTLTLSSLHAAEESLHYSPLTAFELAGKWSSRTFEERRAAANAILMSGAQELPDQDSYFTRDIFRYGLRRRPVALLDAVKAMASSRDIESLERGVADFKERVIRKVSVPTIAGFRAAVEGQWVKDMIRIQEREIPGFETWYRSGPTTRKQQVPRLRGAAKGEFLEKTISPNWDIALLIGCHERALLGAKTTQPAVSRSEAYATVSAAKTALSCYCALYTKYLVRLLVDGALPDPNDSGDIELFPYAIDDHHIVVTSEKKWKRMAVEAGFGQRVELVWSSSGLP
jgi:hypothetical protein